MIVLALCWFAVLLVLCGALGWLAGWGKFEAAVASVLALMVAWLAVGAVFLL